MEDIDFEAVGLDFDLNDTFNYSTNEENQLVKKEVTAKSFVGKRNVTVKEALEQINDSQSPTKNSDILAARIEDSYEEYVNMMENKIKNNNVPLDGTRIIIDSFDGAEHKRTTKGRIGIISFNSQMLCKSSISKISPAGSTNILTWQQIVGEEKLSTLLPALKDAYQTKMNI